MTDNKLNLCAWAYLEYYRSGFKKYAWAYDYVDELIRKGPQESLHFVVELLNLCQSEQEIAYIAAGPLEDLLHRYLHSVQGDIEMYCQKNKLMQTAIRYVWAQEKSTVYNFLNHLHAKFGTSSDKDVVNSKGG